MLDGKLLYSVIVLMKNSSTYRSLVSLGWCRFPAILYCNLKGTFKWAGMEIVFLQNNDLWKKSMRRHVLLNSRDNNCVTMPSSLLYSPLTNLVELPAAGWFPHSSHLSLDGNPPQPSCSAWGLATTDEEASVQSPGHLEIQWICKRNTNWICMTFSC